MSNHQDPSAQPVSKRERVDLIALERESLSVDDEQQAEYVARLRTERTNLSLLEPYVLHRHSREAIQRVIDVLERIAQNCELDPRDVRIGLKLPLYVEHLTEAVDAYVRLAGQEQSKQVHSELLATEEMLIEAPRALEELLEEMRSNDGLLLGARARVLKNALD